MPLPALVRPPLLLTTPEYVVLLFSPPMVSVPKAVDAVRAIAPLPLNEPNTGLPTLKAIPRVPFMTTAASAKAAAEFTSSSPPTPV